MKREWSWFNRIFFAVFVLVLIGVIVFLAWRWSVASDERTQLINALTQSQAQLRDEGIEPEAPEPEQIVQGAVGATGERGPRGFDGDDGADSLIPGPAGAPGSDGRDSTIPGSAGSPGADSTIPGPPGADSTVPGPQGLPGADGRGIQSLYCDDITGRWTVTYTDTTTADAGACRTEPLEGVTP